MQLHKPEKITVALTMYFFICCIFILNGCRKTDSFSLKPVADNNFLSGAVNSSSPNIVLILLDDIGFEVPTCYGGQSYETPNLDKMAQEGMRFTQCYGSPVCSPSRFMLMTGKYNFRNYTLWGKMDPNEKTIATLLKNAGYATYVSGKWQFDGGDASIHSLGFDDYSIWQPFDRVPGRWNHYKNPAVYEKGAYLSSAETDGKYGDDIFTDRVLRFIDSSQSKKFFVYFPITLSHAPFVPTPDDPEFATWPVNQSDTTFFRSMVKYMDKKVGQVVEHLKETGLYNNTIIMVAGDNGTSEDIYSKYNGKLTRGGKGKTNIYGTKLPFIVTCPNLVSPGQIDTNLVDFTDILPTFAEAANTAIPFDYGTIDGKSFYKQLLGDFSIKRSWVYNYFRPSHEEAGLDVNPAVQQRLQIWANTAQYKLYDSTYNFYDIIKDPFEKKPLTTLTPAQREMKDSLQRVIGRMHN